MVNLINNYLKKIGLKFISDKIALTFEEGDDYYGISYNYMGTGIHIPKEQIDEAISRLEEIELCKEQGVKIWKTWSYNIKN